MQVQKYIALSSDIGAHMTDHKIWKNASVFLFLILGTITIYWPITGYDFINFDDPDYVYENPNVKNGLTQDGILWAFSFEKKKKTYWHPLTWISHMCDCQFFNTNAGFHHAINLFFHIANTLLLFSVLKRMTKSHWKSAFVATLFAIHPINVDTVVWVAERKNVLSTFFWILTMLCYSWYVNKKTIGRYVLTVFVFGLGLLAKPMLVTLPFILLLLDYWPLDRIAFQKDKPGVLLKLIYEKIPFLLLSFASILVSMLSVFSYKNTISTEIVPINFRIANALISYIAYIGKLLWPSKLAVFYPYPQKFAGWQVGIAIVFLCGISTLMIWQRKERPYLITGWLWFLGTLVPVSGLIQTGLWPALADRWAYVPFIGLFIMIAWGIPSILKEGRFMKALLSISAGILLSLMAILSVIQIGHWKDSGALFAHAIKVTGENPVAHNNLGTYLMDNGRFHEAGTHFLKVLRLEPGNEEAHSNLGMALVKQGNPGAAISHFKKALFIDPHNAELCSNMGNALASSGNMEAAMAYYRRAIEIKPNYADAHNNLAIVLAMQGNLGEAIVHFKKALSLKPGAVEIENNLKRARIEKYRREKATSH